MDARLLVGKNVARVRAAKGLSQTQLVDLIDPKKLLMGQSYLSKLERGHKNVTIMTLAVLADVMDVRIAEFFREDEELS